jgi:hypothetical protein
MHETYGDPRHATWILAHGLCIPPPYEMASVGTYSSLVLHKRAHLPDPTGKPLQTVDFLGVTNTGNLSHPKMLRH